MKSSLLYQGRGDFLRFRIFCLVLLPILLYNNIRTYNFLIINVFL